MKARAAVRDALEQVGRRRTGDDLLRPGAFNEQSRADGIAQVPVVAGHRGAHAERPQRAARVVAATLRTAAQLTQLRLDGVLEGATHDAVAHGVDGRVGVPQPHGVRVKVTQQYAVARQLLRREEVEADTERVDRQP